MKKIKLNKRFLTAFIAAALLLTAIPLISAFAGEDNTVSSSDLEMHTVSASGLDTANPYDDYGGFIFSFDPGTSGMNFYDGVDIGCVTDFENRTATFTAPECSNEINTFIYWRDKKLGKIYHPNVEYTLTFDQLGVTDEMLEEISHGVWYGFVAEAVWTGDELLVEGSGTMNYLIPTEDENYFVGDSANTEPINKYDTYEQLEFDFVARYNLKTMKFIFEGDNGYYTIPDGYIPEYDGHTFIEWNSAADGSGTGYQPGDRVKIYDPCPALFAIFDSTCRNTIEVDAFEVMMVTDDGGGRYLFMQHFNDDGFIEEFTAPPALENKIAEFDYWYDPLNDAKYYPGQTYYNVDVKPYLEQAGEESAQYWQIGNQMYLRAKWKQEEIYFERNGMVLFIFEGGGSDYYELPMKGRYNTRTEEYIFEEGNIYTIPLSQVPESVEYTFLGWCPDESGHGTLYHPGDTITLTEPWLNLYAVFEDADHFTIIEDFHGSRVVNFVKSVAPTDELVMEDGKTFEEVDMLITEVDEDTSQAVLASIAEKTEITEIDDLPNYEMLDLTLVDDRSNPVAIEEGSVKITLKYPDIENAQDYDYTVYHYTGSGVEEIETEKLDSGIVFYAASFSPYALVWNEPTQSGSDDPTNPSDDPTNPSDDPTNPSDDPTNPSDDPTNPSDDPTNPSDDPTNPSDDPSNPSDDPSNPGDDPGVQGEEQGQNDTSASPTTGDSFNPVIFIVLLILSAAAAAGAVVYLRLRAKKDEAEA